MYTRVPCVRALMCMLRTYVFRMSTTDCEKLIRFVIECIQDM